MNIITIIDFCTPFTVLFLLKRMFRGWILVSIIRQPAEFDQQIELVSVSGQESQQTADYTAKTA
jgi:hypothetical protein